MGRSIQVPPTEAPNNWAGAAWSYERQQFGDVTEQAGAIGGWQITCNQLGRGRYAASSDILSVRRITIIRDRINLPIGQDTLSPRGSVALFFPLRSEGGWRVDGRCDTEPVVALRQGRTHLLVAPGGESELLHVEVPALLLGLDANDARIQSRRLRPEDEFLRDWLLCLLGQAQTGGVFDPSAAAALEELLLMRLARCAEAFSPAPCETISRSAAIDLLCQLEHILLEEEDIPETFGAFCARRSLAPGELATAAQAAFGQAPERWYRMVRLNGVHRDLRTKPKGLTVTRAATRWGFFHLGRFSGDYAAFFGRHPRETLNPG